MRDLDELFAALAKSRFRSRFALRGNALAYFRRTGLATVREHARRFIDERLAPANPANDGRQTPMRGHPVFLAQHATATCCRGCLAKWHGIPAGRELTAEEREYVVEVIEQWLRQQAGDSPESSQGSLFE
ncbi:MAG: DUF4186 domain-containing protein [Tepidisphaeraceae bacterium]|jgi:predicted Fe-S protein YdhL (DUF1289 family)